MTDYLNPQQFAEHFKPTEYGQTWDEVVQHARHGNCCGVREYDAYGRGLNEQMRQSIKDHGIDTPVQVKGGWVTDGHHRVAAALAGGSRYPIPYDEGDEYYEGQIREAERGRRLGRSNSDSQ